MNPVAPASKKPRIWAATESSSPDGHVGGPVHLLLVEEPAVGGQLAVDGELAGGPLPGLVHVGCDRHRQADNHLRGRSPGGGRRFGDGRDDAALHHRPSGHPGDGALGQLAGQAQHGRSEGGDQDGKGLGVRHPEGADHGRGPQRLSGEIDGPLVDQGPQHGQVLPHVEGRPLEGDTHHPLDDQLVGQPDAENESPPDGGLGGEGLSGQHHGVTGPGGNHGRTEGDVRYLPAGDGHGSEGVDAEDLGQPGRPEPGIGHRPDLIDDASEAGLVGDVHHHPDLHLRTSFPGTPRTPGIPGTPRTPGIPGTPQTPGT
jgi:hypothetical protein